MMMPGAGGIQLVRPIEAVLLEGLIEQHLIGRSLDIFGEPRVNVLELNLALEPAFPRHEGKPSLRSVPPQIAATSCRGMKASRS